MTDRLPFQPGPDGVRVAVRLTPKGGRDQVEGLGRDSEGRAFVRARVSAPPEKGAANAALVALLARTWDLPRSSLALVSGATARAKIVRIAGEPSALLPRLERWARQSLHERAEA